MRRLKKATPEFEEVDEAEEGEEGWVSYQSDAPNMTLLRPLLRTAEAMLDPTKPNSYHIKLSAAKKMVEKMDGYTIEGEAIVRALPFKVEYSYKPNAVDKAIEEPLYNHLRMLLGRLPADAYKDIEGISIFNDTKAPAQLKKRWLYVSTPTTSTIHCGVAANFGPTGYEAAVHGDRRVSGRNDADFPARFPRNGISMGGGSGYDFALYAPQTVYLKMYVASYYMANVIYQAIASGAQLAMAFTGGSVDLKTWLPEVGSRYTEERRKRAEKAEEDAKKYELEISKASDTILNNSLKLEEAREVAEMLKKPLTSRDITKELPGLAMVESVNRDDPYKTVIRTKDIVLHGVNLGPYVITLIHQSLQVAVMGTKVAPDGIVHPNIWQEKGKWTQDFDKDRLKELVSAMGAGNIHVAANLIINNLLNCPNSGAHAERLEALRKAIEEKDKKAAEKKAAKTKKADAAVAEAKPEPKLEEATK